MRMLSRPQTFLAITAGATAFVAMPASAAPRSVTPETVRIFVAPVDASGHATAGITVKGQGGLSVYCNTAEPSPSSISGNVEECSPSAAYAVACWKSATAGHVLCMRDPRKREIDSMKLVGRFAPTKPVSAKELAPFVLVLADGSFCEIRDGGAWGSLKGHPNFYGTYSCSKHGVIWAKANAPHQGVNESLASWTVRTSGGNAALVVRHVVRAYFVATANG